MVSGFVRKTGFSLVACGHLCPFLALCLLFWGGGGGGNSAVAAVVAAASFSVAHISVIAGTSTSPWTEGSAIAAASFAAEGRYCSYNHLCSCNHLGFCFCFLF